MKVSAKSYNALKVMLAVAQNGNDSCISLKELSERVNISAKYMEQIISILTRAGCLRSTRGSMGGYSLSKPAEEYVIGDLIRTVEGSLSPVNCIDFPDSCPNKGKCKTITFWNGLNRVINNYVDKFTLADLLSENVNFEKEGTDQ